MANKHHAPGEPNIAALPGGSPLRDLQRFALATRPQFLTASALPVVVGTAWAAGGGHGVDAVLFLLAFLATGLVHAACNVLNDVSDEINGSDRDNAQRIYPFTGGSRFIQNGILSQTSMTVLGLTLLAAACTAGIALVALRGPGVFAFGLAGVLLGVAYSIPPAALVSRGLGEAVVAITFGWLPIAGAAWLQGASLDVPLLLLSVPVGVWVASILLLNEVPDAHSDAAVGKRTLVVRAGRQSTARIYLAGHAAGYLALLALVGIGSLHAAVLLFAVPGVLLAIRVSRAIGGYSETTRDTFAAAIRLNLALHAAGSIWLAAVMVLLPTG